MFNEKELEYIKNIFLQITFKCGQGEQLALSEGIIKKIVESQGAKEE